MNASKDESTLPSTGTNELAPPVPEPSERPEAYRLSPGVRAFITQMCDHLNTHQPGVPRGTNQRNRLHPEFSPQP